MATEDFQLTVRMTGVELIELLLDSTDVVNAMFLECQELSLEQVFLDTEEGNVFITINGYHV